MTDFRRLVFATRATNDFGAFEPGDRCQARFPPDLVAAYVRHGILVETAAPVTLGGQVKAYGPTVKARRPKGRASASPKPDQ